MQNYPSSWITKIKEWLYSLFKLFKKKTIVRPPKILKRIDGQATTLLQLERETPGAIATYRFISAYSNTAYLLTLDSITGLNSDLYGNFKGTSFRLRPSIYSRSSEPTHRFAFFEVGNNGSFNIIAAWDIDLQGSVSGVKGEAAAIRAISATALFPLLIKDVSICPWNEQIKSIDWLYLLQENAKVELGVNHNLKARMVLTTVY